MTKKTAYLHTHREGAYKEPHIPKIKTDQGLAKSLDEFHGETGSETTFLDRKLCFKVQKVCLLGTFG